MKGTNETTQDDIIKIEKYAALGMTDSKITQKLKIKLHVVQKISNQYWKRKMEKKNN